MFEVALRGKTDPYVFLAPKATQHRHKLHVYYSASRIPVLATAGFAVEGGMTQAIPATRIASDFACLPNAGRAVFGVAGIYHHRLFIRARCWIDDRSRACRTAPPGSGRKATIR